MDLTLGLEGTHVLVTGGAGFIGTAVVQAFLAANCTVTALDLPQQELRMSLSHPNLHWRICDIADEEALESTFESAATEHGVVACCVALAGLDLSYLDHHESLCEMSLAQWRRTFRVNAEGAFLTARTWLRGIRAHAPPSTPNVSLVIIGSEAGTFGVTGNADYSASKSAIQYGLVQSLVKDIVRIHPNARVNAVAPGAVDTPQFRKECAEDSNALWMDTQATVATKRPVGMEGVARQIVMLASEKWSGDVSGQVVAVNGGKSGKVHWMPGEACVEERKEIGHKA